MRFACLTATVMVLVACASVAKPPITNAEAAIRIAKAVCKGKADPRLQWRAELDSKGKTWIADTQPSLRKTGDPLWSVAIPVDGPLPSTCYDSLYDLVSPQG